MTERKAAPESDVLRRMTVRLLPPEALEERARFDELLEKEHYLHSARLGGQSLRYVAEVDGQWVALITFSGAAPHTKAREEKIDWTPRQRARRLPFVVNNSRFLILPSVQVKGLASTILARSARQLPQDWRQHYGYVPLLLETLVDGSRFKGTCYRAANWIYLGKTAGGNRTDRLPADG